MILFALLEDFFSQMALWEKIVGSILGFIGSLWAFKAIFVKVLKSIQKANQSISDLFDVVPDLKAMAQEFGPGSANSLKLLIKRIENSQNHTDQKIKVILFCMGVAAFESDKNGLYTFISKKWAEITKTSFDEAIGNGWLNIIDEEERDEVYKEWISCTQQNREFHCTFKLSNNKEKGVSVVAWPIRNTDGSIEKFFGILI